MFQTLLDRQLKLWRGLKEMHFYEWQNSGTETEFRGYVGFRVLFSDGSTNIKPYTFSLQRPRATVRGFPLKPGPPP